MQITSAEWKWSLGIQATLHKKLNSETEKHCLSLHVQMEDKHEQKNLQKP